MKTSNYLRKSVFIFACLTLSCTLLQAQLNVESTGKIQVGTKHSLSNGWLKMGNDGVNNGISFYQTSNGGTDFRILRNSNIGYLVRGSDLAKGLRMNSTGDIAIGSLQNGITNATATSFSAKTTVYANGNCAFSTFFDYNGNDADAQKSTVYRPCWERGETKPVSNVLTNAFGNLSKIVIFSE